VTIYHDNVYISVNPFDGTLLISVEFNQIICIDTTEMSQYFLKEEFVWF